MLRIGVRSRRYDNRHWKRSLPSRDLRGVVFGAKLQPSILYLHFHDNEFHPHHASFETKKEHCKMVCLLYSYVQEFGLSWLCCQSAQNSAGIQTLLDVGTRRGDRTGFGRGDADVSRLRGMLRRLFREVGFVWKLGSVDCSGLIVCAARECKQPWRTNYELQEEESWLE